MSVLGRVGLLGAVAVVPLAGAAFAQDDFYSRNKYEAVRDRSQPDFDPEPVRVGSLIVRSNAEISAISDSNIFADSTDEQSDTIIRAGARANVRTDWSNHELSANASAFRNTYLDFDDESNEDLRAGLGGRLDVTRSWSFTANVDAAQRTEERVSQANAVSLDEPVEIETLSGRVGANYRNDRIRWDSSVRVSENDFQDGEVRDTDAVFDQDFRDNTAVVGRTRVSYAISPNVAVFTQAEYNTREYDLDTGRDSSGYALYGGFDFELDALVRGDVAVGYFDEDKDSDALEDVSGLAVDGRLQWFPTRLTTVGFNAGRSVQDLGLVESSSATQTRFGARVDHELRRNIIVSGFASIADEDYDDIDRTDEVLSYGISATYKLNKNVHTEAFARHTERDASGADISGDPNFEADVIGLVVRIFP
ncbi:MAG: outer membrane beta-barrel protein [Pseudomonadota bacterium]